MTLREAQVAAVHPGRQTADIVFLDNGQHAADVRIASSAASSDGGGWSVPDVPKPKTERQAGSLNRSGRSMVALCGTVNGQPVIVGFLPPQGGQVAFTDQNRAAYRHPSGAYVTVAPDGSIEAYHPGGSYLRIGSGEHEDLAGAAANGWSIPGGSPAQITLVTAGFTLKVTPGGTVEMEADTAVTVKTPSVTVDTPQSTFTGAVTVQGVLTYQGGMMGSGGSGAAATIQGAVQVTGGDVKADGVGLKSHTHPDAQGGNTSTGAG